VNVGFGGEKRETSHRAISFHCPYDPSHLITTKIGKVGGKDKVIKPVEFGVHRLFSAGSARS
jgi:hypothetical protein